MNYLCALCVVAKQDKLELEQHIRTVHDKRNLKYEPCGKTFVGKNHYIITTEFIGLMKVEIKNLNVINAPVCDRFHR